MRNPWVDLPVHAPFILREDLPGIGRYDHAHPNRQVRTNVLPVPFLGNPAGARVLLLSLNPGYSDQGARLLAENVCYADAHRRALLFSADPPFFYLSPEFADTSGYRWWSAKLSALIARVGRARVMADVSCIEYFPYASVAYHPFGEYLPSQYFGFHLVRQAMQNQKVIVIMRSVSRWLAAVPELTQYPYMSTRNVRNPTISPGNIPDGRFEEIVRVLG